MRHNDHPAIELSVPCDSPYVSIVESVHAELMDIRSTLCVACACTPLIHHPCSCISDLRARVTRASWRRVRWCTHRITSWRPTGIRWHGVCIQGRASTNRVALCTQGTCIRSFALWTALSRVHSDKNTPYRWLSTSDARATDAPCTDTTVVARAGL